MSEQEFADTFPLDQGGFLRRACPACGREFKWLPSDAIEEAAPEPSTYFCPYCGAPAPADEWFTDEQAAHINDELMEQILGPSLEGLSESLRGLERSSGGLIRGSLEGPSREHAPPVFEPDDMRRVDFVCHPAEPVKVEDSWADDVFCLMCGLRRDATAQ